MRLFFAVAVFLGLLGCASTSTQYYEAVQKAAQANAAASQAKFDALSKIAASGDGQAASAAVMALAMTQTPVVQPIPQQSEALQWASILAAPVSSLGMMWIQADSAKKMAEYNSQVDLARISAESADNQSLYAAFNAGNAQTANVATAGFTALGNIDYTPFVDGMVTLGTTGMTQLGDLGAAGINGVTTVGVSGFGAMTTLDAGNNDLLGGIWSEYTAAISAMLEGLPKGTCSATTNADGTLSVTCE